MVKLPIKGQNTSLKILGLSRNAIGDEGAIAIVKALRSNTASSLKELAIDDNQIGPEGKQALKDLMKEKGGKLKILYE